MGQGLQLAGASGALQQLLEQRRLQQLQSEDRANKLAQQQAENDFRRQTLGLQSRGLDLQERGLGVKETPHPVTLGEGQSLVDPTTGRIIAAIPAKSPTAKGPMNVAPGGTIFDPDKGVLYTSPFKPPSDNEPLVPIIGPDGKPVLVTRAEARGRRPANSREQGRPVVSGDAGRIADLDQSLNDLQTLSTQLGQTGPASWLGAHTPNAISAMTGFGVEAKSRQAVIDRVKQVIGKALEGGVLRKEDEIKYEKILPTIGDPGDVATSKLRGLSQALTQKRSTLIDALRDAGYDVDRYAARTPAALGGNGGPVAMIAPDGRQLMVPADKVAEMEAHGAKRR